VAGSPHWAELTSSGRARCEMLGRWELGVLCRLWPEVASFPGTESQDRNRAAMMGSLEMVLLRGPWG
jgi:hypothetical protein